MLYKAIKSHIGKLKDNLYTSSVGEIISLNYRGDFIESVNVRPSINTVYTDGDERPKPIVHNVPVVFLSGGGGIISFPLQVGDTVLLVYGREDITQFLKDKTPNRPDTQRKFSYNDAIAIPCVTPFKDSLKPSKDNFEIKFKDTLVRIDKEGNVLVDGAKKVDVKSATSVSVEAADEVSVQAPRLLLSTPEVVVEGSITMTGSLTMAGSLSVAGDISTPSVGSLNDHTHNGVTAGSGISGKPTE